MDTIDFEGLKESVREMIAIERDHVAPARKRVYQGKVLIRIEEDGQEVWSLSLAANSLHRIITEAKPRSHAEFIRVLRDALNQSQEGFAEFLTIPLATLQGWEQGRRIPDAAAEKLLRLTARCPEVVLEDHAMQKLEFSFSQ